MSRQRSRSASGRRDYSTKDLHDLYNSVTSDTVPSVDSDRKRSISVSRTPTDRVPLGQDSSDKTRLRGRFPATFESLADPQLRSTPPPHTPTRKPVKGILKTSSRSPSTPIRPSSAVSFEASAPTNGHRSYRPSFVRSYSSTSFNSSQTPAATPKVPDKPSDTPSQSTMGGKAAGRAKARDATALYDVGASPAKKAGRVNGSKKTDDVSDEGSSSSDEDSDSSSSDESESEDEDKGRQNTAAPASAKKAAPAPAADSSDSESESSDSDDEPAKPETKKPASASAATNGAEESSSEEESDSENDDGGAKVAPAKGKRDSSTESSESESSDESSDSGSDEDSDEEMADAPASAPQPSRGGMVRAAQRAPAGPPPSVMEGGFKLQTAQNMGHMASVLSEAKAKGDRVWLLTHPSTTPLNLEVQKILPSADSHRNSIFPNGAKLTYPAASDGKNVHVISGCDSITVTQTLRNDADISSLAQVASGNLRQPKEAPAQPAGLRSRFLPIGVDKASPTLENALAVRPKKERKKKEKEEAEERPSKKRKVAAPAEAAPEATEAKKAEGKPKKSKKSKAEEETTPAETPRKGKVKFADDEAPRSLTPIPPPSIPGMTGSQAKETPSKEAGKKKRRVEGEGEPAEKKKKAAERPPPEGVKITPVAPPVVPGMQ